MSELGINRMFLEEAGEWTVDDQELLDQEWYECDLESEYNTDDYIMMKGILEWEDKEGGPTGPESYDYVYGWDEDFGICDLDICGDYSNIFRD